MSFLIIVCQLYYYNSYSYLLEGRAVHKLVNAMTVEHTFQWCGVEAHLLFCHFHRHTDVVNACYPHTNIVILLQCMCCQFGYVN